MPYIFKKSALGELKITCPNQNVNIHIGKYHHPWDINKEEFLKYDTKSH